MVPKPSKGRPKAPDVLAEAVGQTFAVTAGSAAEGRERAQELLDEIAGRGREAGRSVARRGQEAGEGLSEAVKELLEKSQSRLKG
jgi:polyhydroxyalkanoate synthesis regulator phasin